MGYSGDCGASCSGIPSAVAYDAIGNIPRRCGGDGGLTTSAYLDTPTGVANAFATFRLADVDVIGVIAVWLC